MKNIKKQVASASPPTLLVLAGGTGGHIFPALAVAETLRAQGWRIVWLGTHAGLEATLVPSHGFTLEYIDFAGLRGKGWRSKLQLPATLLRACWQSWRVIKRVQPDVVLGMGGYISFPAGIMAALTKRPLILHEQNAIAGLANRLLARFAHHVLVAFPYVLPRAQWTGNPLGAHFLHVPSPKKRYAQRNGPLRVLVVGGSLGATALNDMVPAALALLPEAQRPWVVHQAGQKHLDTLRARYQRAGLLPADHGVQATEYPLDVLLSESSAAPHLTVFPSEDTHTPHTDVQTGPLESVSASSFFHSASPMLLPFIEDMREAYAEADLVICRAGAMTVAEVAAVGVAALFIPFPHAVDNHQTHNAAFLAERQAAYILQQSELSAATLAAWLSAQTRHQLMALAEKAQACAMPDAAQHVAQICIKVQSGLPHTAQPNGQSSERASHSTLHTPVHQDGEKL